MIFLTKMAGAAAFIFYQPGSLSPRGSHTWSQVFLQGILNSGSGRAAMNSVRVYSGRILSAIFGRYQWLPMESTDAIESKMKRMRGLVAGIDNVYFNIKSERHSYYQALLSLGDRRVAPAIEQAEANGGQWLKAVADAGVDGDFYIYRDRSADAVLPWSMIDGGMKEPFFRAEFEKSTRAEWTLPPKRAKENARLLPMLS